jgi:hypothetical protein
MHAMVRAVVQVSLTLGGEVRMSRLIAPSLFPRFLRFMIESQ